MPVLSRHAPKLLATVNGKRHATDEDHEEPPAKRTLSPAEEDYFAEPLSTDDELPAPPQRPSKPPVAVTASPKADGLPAPPTRSVTAASAVTGRRNLDGANAAQNTPQSSTGGPGDLFGFGMEHASQRSSKSSQPKITFGSKAATPNIHTRPPAKKPVKFGKRAAIRVPNRVGKPTKIGNRDKQARASDDDSSDCSMLDEDGMNQLLGPAEQHDPELRKAELLHSTPEDKSLKRTLRRSRPTVLHDQLGDWRKDRAPESSQPTSSAQRDDRDNVHEYIDQLPGDDVEGSCCPLCRTPVHEEDYWQFWKGKSKTVKNQNVFCRDHKIKSAQDEFRNEGYRDIDWTALPRRITKLRMELFKILHNDRASIYRDRYEPIALTGKAAAVPSRRKDLPHFVQQELESYALDDQSTYPGYYGPHGRRVITETVMKILKNEIKNCSDTVVQGSGPATFIQAVLVPETAIMLIMEDCLVDREGAEEIREKTYELGMLLNEEIEDQLEAHEQSDDENEYGGK
ncbi:RTC4-like domain-containing protein [Ampelomyces quisqualis]|uniref:Restriction of telomere capping protein 4 n=1 Tax=Ampelomyces quisqualis TaxID=50730 RepID=A0A6A5QCE3_AMPQU|nr:RTC4-like domain-containing protein [Ampelomyces quisqualis]